MTIKTVSYSFNAFNYSKLETFRLESHSEKIQLMRKSNFNLKSKIDILMDLLQVQKEKHLDLKQELNRMLIDIG